MMLLRSLSSPSPDDAELNTWFHRRWGRENCIIWGRVRHADFGPYTHTLSIRAVWGGAQYCHLNRRTIAVDDDSFLILNHGQIYSTSIHSEVPVEALAICFRPDLVEDIENDAAASLEQALSRDRRAIEPGWDFCENLHPHDNKVSTVLRFIKAHLMQGLVDAAWYDEQLMFLLARMKSHRDRLYERVNSIALVRPATRREVYRRIGLATDFMHTNYAGEVDLQTLAGMAHLSKYHFLRLFALVHGVTPHNYLQRKRITRAARLLASTQRTMGEVAQRVGFAEVSTLVRQMRRWIGLTPNQIRTRMQVDPAV
jgi:AraC family transcriptional regulator